MLKEARLLLDHRYPLGTANRAYYATHEAACAALTHLLVPVPRTHGRVIATFLEVVVVGRADVPESVVGAFQGALQARMTADYARGARPSLTDARTTYDGAREFVHAVAQAYFPDLRPGIPRLSDGDEGYRA